MPFDLRIEDQDVENVRTFIKKSTIPNADKGLFANKSIKKGDTVAQYIGVYVPMHFIDLDYYNSDYLLQFPQELMCIDASDKLSCYGRYVNDSLSRKQINVKITKDMADDGAKLIAIRDIKKKEEIFMSYGIEYWTEKNRLSKLSKEDHDFITTGQLEEYIDSIHIESDDEDEDDDDVDDVDDVDNEVYDSDR